mmetsp:Transcript_2086/g.6203  ORF Transcript_2086/g.6203 Transcript_2086/m.6203 type:complete len:209 (-) Transcript_2086:63-689(-)
MRVAAVLSLLLACVETIHARDGAGPLTFLSLLAGGVSALYVHPGAGQRTVLKPPPQPIDPFNPFGAPPPDDDGPMHGHDAVGEHLTTDHLAILARLAARMKHMQLEDIEQVVVIGLSETELELQVMACEDEECISVLVPVEFIAPCCQADDDGYEECVMDNLLTLDGRLAAEEAAEQAKAAPAPPSAKYMTYGLPEQENVLDDATTRP